MTIDVEDWRQLLHRKLTGEVIPPDPLVIEETRLILRMLAARDVRATFFVLGNITAAFPELVREIHGGGHEIGCHGLSHKRVYDQTPEEFRAETVEARERLLGIVGGSLQGYRAAEFSITRASLWALDILAEVGFAYDSSIYPIAGARYGIPNFPLDPCRIQTAGGQRIVEFPLTAVERAGSRQAVAGGGYFRLYPYSFTRNAIAEVNSHSRAAVVYLHPYEFSTRLLRVRLPSLAPRSVATWTRNSLLHNFGRARLRRRFQQLLEEFSFAPLGELIKSQTQIRQCQSV